MRRGVGLAVPVAIALACVAVAGLAGLPSTARAQGNVQGLLATVEACPKQNAIWERPAVQERAMRCLIDTARRRSGVQPLAPSLALTRSARLKSRDIRRCGSFSHQACGRSFEYWIERVGYRTRCWSAAENIAWAQRLRGSPRKILASWLRSPGHREAVLDSRYRDLGVGVRRTGNPRWPASQTWTAHFGHQC